MKRIVLLVVALLFFTLKLSAQNILTAYTQDFEDSSTKDYTTQGGTISTQLYKAGVKSFRLVPSSATDVILELPAIDLNGYPYASLEFQHICNVKLPDQARVEVAVEGGAWVKLDNSYIMREYAYSTNFDGDFSANSYPQWNVIGSPTNTWWKTEKFNLQTIYGATISKKVKIRFVIPTRRVNPDLLSVWYIDAIKVSKSKFEMTKPTITMTDIPDPIDYSNNRPAKIQGIVDELQLDSAYILYRQNNGPWQKEQMSKTASSPYSVQGAIPFNGYGVKTDWKVYAVDASPNKNTSVYPSADTFMTYVNVRSYPALDSLYHGLASSNYNMTGVNQMQSLLQSVYQKDLLYSRGYKAGNIKGIYLSSKSMQTERFHLTVRMKNVPENYVMKSSMFELLNTFHTVYSGEISFTGSSWNYIPLMDTFRYNGEGHLVIQYCIDYAPEKSKGDLFLKAFPDDPNYKSIQTLSASQSNTCSSFINGSTEKMYRPDIMLDMVANQPLFYDVFLDSIVTPHTWANSSNETISVQVKNMGLNPLTELRFYYKVDNEPTEHFYKWTGSLSPGTSSIITIANSVNYAVGARSIQIRVSDTVNASLIDYENLNNSGYAEFDVCGGGVSGVKSVGNVTGTDFQSLEMAFRYINNCGVTGPLSLELEGGTYTEMLNLEQILGSSVTNVVTIKPKTGQEVTFQYHLDSTKNISSFIRLLNTQNLVFEGLKFNVTGSSEFVNLISIEQSMGGVEFRNCQMTSLGAKMNAFISILGGEGTIIKQNTIVGGRVALLMQQNGNRHQILSNQLTKQSRSSLSIVDQRRIYIENNTIEADSAQNALVVLTNCYEDSYFGKNRVFDRGGQTCISINGFTGTNMSRALIANNMFSSISKESAIVVKFISSENCDFVYNSVLVNSSNTIASSPIDIGDASGTPKMQNVRIINNIFNNANKGYALRLKPSTATSNIQLDYNNYFAAEKGKFAFQQRQGSSELSSFAAWKQKFSDMDAHSVNVNAYFFSPTDLRSYASEFVGAALPLSYVNSDIFGTTRSSASSCIGAYEYVELDVNLAIEAFLSPESNCRLGLETVAIQVKNKGKNSVSAGTTFKYRVGEAGTIVSQVFPRSILPGKVDTIVFVTKADLANSSRTENKVFTITAWVDEIAGDLDKGNDTLSTEVSSFYRLAALPDVVVNNVTYATSATARVSSPDSVYWFNREGDFLQKGDSIKDIYFDTTVYLVAAKREIPKLKITELYLNPNGVGYTTPIPKWLLESFQFAIEISNVGTYPANLSEDTLYAFHTPTTGGDATPKYTLPSIIIEPGQSIVIQFNANEVTDSTKTITLPIIAKQPNSRSKLAFALKGKNSTMFTDYVPLNGFVIPKNMPAIDPQIWSGGTITIDSFTAGIRRVSFLPNQAAWVICDDNNPMTLGTNEPNVVMYPPSYCMGDTSKVTVNVVNIPYIDAALKSVSVQNQGCNLGMETVSVVIRNNGLNLISGGTITVAYQVYDSISNTVLTTPVDKTLSTPLSPGAEASLVFSDLADLSTYDKDKVFLIKAFIRNIVSDSYLKNDTILSKPIYSSKTPKAPIVSDTSISYGESVNLIPDKSSNPSDSLRWYTSDTTLIGMHNTLKTGSLYEDVTYLTQTVSIAKKPISIGTREGKTNQMQNSPFFSKYQFSKQQFIVSAEDLKKGGAKKGNLSQFNFYIDSLWMVSGSVIFEKYRIYLAPTNQLYYDTTGSFIEINEAPYYSGNNLVYEKSTAERKWHSIFLDKPFSWDGESNILVQILAKTNTSIPISTDLYYTPKITVVSSTSTTDSIVFTAKTYTKQSINTKYPTFISQLVFDTLGCESELVPITVEVTGVPTDDASIVQILSPPEEGNQVGVQLPVSAVLKNLGNNLSPMTNATVYYRIGTNAPVSYTWTGSLDRYEMDTVELAPITMNQPGRHLLKVWVDYTGDVFHQNDTAEIMFSVCYPNGTNLLVGASGNFSNIKDALSSLNKAGVCGNIVVDIKPGTYSEQLNFPRIHGLLEGGSILFKSTSGNPEDVIITNTNSTKDSNYLIRIRNTAGITFQGVSFIPRSTTYANAVVVRNSKRVQFKDCIFRREGAADNSTTKNALLLGGLTEDVIVQSNTFEGFNTAVSIDTSLYLDSDLSAKEVAETNIPLGTKRHDNLKLSDNKIYNFLSTGFQLFYANNLTIERNQFHTSRAFDNQRAIQVKYSNQLKSISKNEIVLSAKSVLPRHGLYIESSYGLSFEPALIANNMISIKGEITVAAGSNSYGIYTANVTYFNVVFNSVRLQVTAKAEASSCLFLGAKTEFVNVLNNNLINLSKGYSYRINEAQNANSKSNYNNYQSNGISFAYYAGQTVNSLADFQNKLRNEKEINSRMINSPFLADTNLRQRVPDLNMIGIQVDGIVDDIDGIIRMPSTPAIGASEYQRSDVDIALVGYKLPPYSIIENEDYPVGITLFNTGLQTIDSLTYVVRNVSGTYIDTFTTKINLGPFLRTDPDFLKVNVRLPLGRVGADTIMVYALQQGDTISLNDTVTFPVFILGAFDLQVVRLILTPLITSGCGLNDVAVSIELFNKNNKIADLKGDERLVISYVVPSLNIRVDQDITGFLAALDTNGAQSNRLERNKSKTYNFTTPVTFPQDSLQKVHTIMGFAKLEHDLLPKNDTSSKISVTIYPKPVTPLLSRTDTTIPYATTTSINVKGTTSNLTYYWYDAQNNDSLGRGVSFTTPFIRSIRKFKVVSRNNNGCYSDTAFVTVRPGPIQSKDLQAEVLVSPVSGKVFTSFDTVKILIRNNGLQAVSNFEVGYTKQNLYTSELEQVRETCTDQIESGATYLYKFNSLTYFKDESNYKLTGFVYLAGDATRANDTILATIAPGKYSLYCAPMVAKYDFMDISSVQFGAMYNRTPAIGNLYTNFAVQSSDTTLKKDTTKIEVLEVYKGIVDTLTVRVDNTITTMPIYEDSIPGWMKVFVDWNRNGSFSDLDEVVVNKAIFTGKAYDLPIEIPSHIENGAFLMRVIASPDANASSMTACSSLERGEVEDYKLFVRPKYEVNARLTFDQRPSEDLKEGVAQLKVRIKNVGVQNLTNAEIKIYLDDEPLPERTTMWVGNLMSNQEEVVDLGRVALFNKVNQVKILIQVMGDQYPKDDTVKHVFYLQPLKEIPFFADFNADSAEFVNTENYPYISKNAWNYGEIRAGKWISSATRGKLWYYDYTAGIKYKGGNKSYLYSPKYDATSAKPDSISFYMNKYLGVGAKMYVEYYDASGNWKRLGNKGDGLGVNWYNDTSNTFTGYYMGQDDYRLSAYPLDDDLKASIGTVFQIRFVIEQNAEALDNKMLAIDDFSVARAARPADVAIVSFLNATSRIYGEMFCPKIMVQNRGTTPLTSIDFYYRTNFNYELVKETWHAKDAMGLKFLEKMEFTFSNCFKIDPGIPDTFKIYVNAVVPKDIYNENDNVEKEFSISPLNSDAELCYFVSPKKENFAGDSLKVIVKVHNRGLNRISTLPITYLLNDSYKVQETIDLSHLPGGGLASKDSFEYEFQQKFSMKLGVFSMKAFIALPGDLYKGNDTIVRVFRGISSMFDLQADYISLDYCEEDSVRVQLSVRNMGNAVHSFVAGYFVNEDMSTLVTEVFSSDPLFKSFTEKEVVFSRKMHINDTVFPVRAFVSQLDDGNRLNDTTGFMTVGYRDLAVKKLLIEETKTSDSCRLRIEAINLGSLVIYPFDYEIIIDGDQQHSIKGTYTDYALSVGGKLDIDIAERIAKKENSDYNVFVRLSTKCDVNLTNDTSSVFEIQEEFEVPIIIPEEYDFFIVEQNHPNPFAQDSYFYFTIPNAGKVRVTIINIMGKTVSSEENFFTAGKHIYKINRKDLTSGVYYYVVEYNNIRKVKKMILAR